MAETKVKQNQLDMTQIADASLSNLSDSAPVGLTNSLTPLSKTVGYTVVGSPTISDGIVSGFSASNYLKTTGALPNLATINKLEVLCSFVIDDIDRYNNPIGNSGSLMLQVDANKHLELFRTKSDGTVSAVLVGSATLAEDTKYYVKYVVEKTDSNAATYSLLLSTDNINYVVDVTADSDLDVYAGEYPVIFGAVESSTVLDGSIDLNNTYIKVNGEYWFVGRWQEVSPAHLAMPSSVYESFTPPSSGGGARTQYTAPSDGYFVLSYNCSSGKGAAIMNESKGEMGSYSIHNTGAEYYTGWCIAEKGDTLAVWLTNNPPTVNWLRFYYANGTKYEK